MALVLCEKSLSELSSNLYVLRPSELEKSVFTTVSVSPVSVHTITVDRIIGLD